MTDTAVVEETEELSTEGVTDMPTLWNLLIDAIGKLDEKIDSWNPEAGVRKQFLNELIAENGEASSGQVNKFVEQFARMDERTRYSLYLGLVNGLEEKVGKEADKWVAAQVETLPKPEQVEVSTEVKTAVTSKRSKYYAMTKQLFDMAQLLDIPGSEDWTMPKIRRVGSGKRGKRALSLYNYWIDGVELTGDANSPAGVAEALFGEGTKSSALTKALKGVSVIGDDGKPTKMNTSKPPKEFEVTINGKVLSASRIEGTENVDEDDDSEEDETSEEE